MDYWITCRNAGTRPLGSALLALLELWPAAGRAKGLTDALQDAVGRVLLGLIAKQHAA
ncbi:hypothetical protein ACFFMM_12225 [Micromonospora chaiyaphumensis]|uniref:Uncharacterized protein n=1 Tax=Micromonospora chaiyaphumensis TaxID=307119 RepID=A0A1C4WDY0_9ACTN|nr:hypothetical protein [Micromonospora chaiyaphumensis]SCE94390.1 hypothetical protein GA0070214_103476 [Micromonospora chaiyaphumensis]